MGLGAATLSFTLLEAAKVPEGQCPRWIVIGRSNVGKSSLLNALIHPQKLFHTSRTPGKTRGLIGARVHLGRSEDSALEIVDVPGFGFANVKVDGFGSSWDELLETLRVRSHGAGAQWLWLADPQRKPGDDEERLRAWLGQEPFSLVFTKSDKILARDKAPTLAAWAKIVEGAAEGPYWISALKGSGLEDLFKSARNFVRNCANISG